jgi:tripartite-type tricarboxylate transporter receptor subunit TctC
MGFPDAFSPLSRRTFVIGGVALLSGAARAQQRSYPVRRIDMLIPFPPGTGNDVVGRVVGRHVADTLGQPVVVDNRSGAFGNIAMEATRRAAPDGYTTAMASTSFSVNRWTMLSATYSLDDFTPIAMVATQPYSLMVSKSSAAKDLRELIDLLKKDPQKFNGGQGSGTGYFMLALLNK